MRILFDHNVDRRLRRHLAGHEIKTTAEMGWQKLTNGLLVRAAFGDGFELLLSIDKKIEYEQNLALLPLPIIILDSYSNALPQLLPFVPALSMLLGGRLTPALYVILKDGTVLRLTSPR